MTSKRSVLPKTQKPKKKEQNPKNQRKKNKTPKTKENNRKPQTKRKKNLFFVLFVFLCFYFFLKFDVSPRSFLLRDLV
jgi:hypothetical protein